MGTKYLHKLEELFEKGKNSNNAVPMKKYMKDKFKFFGISSPDRKVIYREFFKSEGLPHIKEIDLIVKALWKKPQREFQYFANFLLQKIIKNLEREHLSLLEYMVVNKSWWDTVDAIASNLIGPFLKENPAIIQKYHQKVYRILSEKIPCLPLALKKGKG